MKPIASRVVDPGTDPAFERFVVEYSRTLLRSAYLLCGDRGVAEDLLQQTLLRTAGQWRAAREAPDAYARRVLINLSRDLRRWARRRPREYSLDPAHWSAVVESPAHGVSERSAVIGALRRLPTRQREVLVLRFYADLSVAETALAIGASEGNVKSYTSRGLSRMRELLADPMDRRGGETAEVQ
jgi:RNA polymerase sigma-70 factor (sigma-E family)